MSTSPARPRLSRRAGPLLPKLHLELVADNSRGSGQNRGSIKTDGGQHFKGGPAVRNAFLTGTCVGLPGIDHDGADARGVFSQDVPGHKNGSGLKTVGGEDSGRNSRNSADHQPQIRAPRSLETALGGRKLKTGRNAHGASRCRKFRTKYAQPRFLTGEKIFVKQGTSCRARNSRRRAGSNWARPWPVRPD